ncbi:MAG: hypothetical protein IT384_00015 [Deltaproteobacteria bacterium]|nr:hypothetical protein [Deltaproteobacteria bacterium]
MIDVNAKQVRSFLAERGLGAEGRSVDNQLGHEKAVTPESLNARADALDKQAAEAASDGWRERIEFGLFGRSEMERSNALSESARELRLVATLLADEEVQKQLQDFVAQAKGGAEGHLAL